MLQYQLFVEKKWPTESGKFTLGVGLNRERDKYSGELTDDDEDLKLIVRPGYSF